MIKLKSIRGMKDILPAETPLWQWCEDKIKKVTERYGYNEIRLPVLEPLSLFVRAVGQSTDIVSKEMYDFVDKSGEHITLRPEGTSGCVRSIIEHNLCYKNQQRLWYLGPMFRYERPQKGRLRQFTQFGVESFGMSGPDIDVELILLVKDLFKELEILDYVTLQINSLGTSSERSEHRKILVEYFNDNKEQLDDDSCNRLLTNPLRILDSKNPEMQSIIENAPQLLDFLSGESKKHFEELCSILSSLDIKYEINPRLVRGLDYYTRTVFEWVTNSLGSQGTVCGGGRYDGLVELFDKKSLPAAGFAMGLERLLLLIQTINGGIKFNKAPDIVVTSEDTGSSHVMISNILRNEFPELKIIADCSKSRIKKQHENAVGSGCKYIITLQKDDMMNLWDLEKHKRFSLTIGDVISYIKKFLFI
ncbi:histidine--tRNA ligase [Salmonella enterica subsp. enterica serovar Glostrup]|nr:histidine--tRNA ligase [Salmonella enterica subsp. enterica serovar Glostrup]EKR1732496.1 histidine--tRNA ligase [Salmonella enterica subsp. enterica serovar Madelia]HAE6914929.1 histidine--tRNA ligase [Salmonella enterica subsp. enterica serovar Madelia]